MKDLLQNQPREVADACFKQAAERITRLQDETVQFMTDTVRQGYSVVCFAETAASVLMWSHYADDHKGFCVEYNLTGDLARLCFPVLYRKKMTDVTKFMFKKDPTDMNNLFPMYASLLKSDEWSYEREWRIVVPTGAPYAHDWITMPKPTAIILGALAKSDDARWMSKFCKDHSIPLRKVVQRMHEFRLEITDF